MGEIVGERQSYTPEFKERAARKVVEGSLPTAQVARELDVNDTTLGFWVKAYRRKITDSRFWLTCRMRKEYGNWSGGTASSRWSWPF